MNDSALKERVLIVDDEESMRVFLKRALGRKGLDASAAADGRAAQDRLSQEEFDLLITDLSMPGMTGIELLRWTKEHDPDLPVIVMTGYGSIPSAIEALKSGATDYITKPFDRGEILKAVESALETRRLRRENRLLHRLLDERTSFHGMVGTAPVMRELYGQIEAVAARDGVVLIQGESGTGKELVARAIHESGPRAGGPFQAFHAGSVPSSLVAVELFGAVPGGYTGVERTREGAVLRAAGGTLFLDEIGDIPLDVQPALLRLLESGEATPVGSSETKQVDVRFVAATHRDLKALVEEGLFREDLYFRLHVFPIVVPPLRRRTVDIPDLIRCFCERFGFSEMTPDLEALAVLKSYDWPGNVRELENLVRRLSATVTAGVLRVTDVPEEFRHAKRAWDGGEETLDDHPLKEALKAFERRYIQRLLARTRGNVAEAARRAGVSRPTLHAKIVQLRCDPDRYR